MPYIDKAYAEKLLRESGNAIGEDAHEASAHGVGAERPACAINEETNGPTSRGRRHSGRVSLEDAVFELEPISIDYSEAQVKAFEKVKRLASARERGTRELMERLAHDGFEREDARSAVDRAVRCGLVDDIRYGAVLVRTRVSQGWGRHGIEQELERAGIVATDIPGWPDEFFAAADSDPFRADDLEGSLMRQGFGGATDDECEVARAVELLRRKPPRAKNVQASAYRKLVTKGYSSSVASVAVRRFLEEN